MFVAMINISLEVTYRENLTSVSKSDKHLGVQKDYDEAMYKEESSRLTFL